MATVSISTEEYKTLKKKEALADNILIQLESSVKDIKSGRVKRVH